MEDTIIDNSEIIGLGIIYAIMVAIIIIPLMSLIILGCTIASFFNLVGLSFWSFVVVFVMVISGVISRLYK